jgi:hypothetical protein
MIGQGPQIVCQRRRKKRKKRKKKRKKKGMGNRPEQEVLVGHPPFPLVFPVRPTTSEEAQEFPLADVAEDSVT